MRSTKSILIAIVALMFHNTGAFSQNSVGLRGGFSMFTVKNFPLESNGQTLTDGLVFGNFNALSFEIGLGRYFALQPEINFIQKGGKIGLANDDNFSLRVKMDYLEMPLLAKFRLGSGPFKGYLTLGPSFGYALNGKTTLEAEGLLIRDNIDFDDSFAGDGRKDNRIDIGLAGGGGVQYRIGPGSIVLDARLALDLNDYNRFEGDKPSGHETTRWEGVSVSLGYQFEFGGQ